MGSAQPVAIKPSDEQAIRTQGVSSLTPLHTFASCTTAGAEMKPLGVPNTKLHSAPLCLQCTAHIQPNIRVIVFVFICNFLAKCKSEARRANQNKTQLLLQFALCLGTVAAMGDVCVCFKVRSRTLQHDHASRFRHKQRHLVLCQSQTVTGKTGLFLPQTELTFLTDLRLHDVRYCLCGTDATFSSGNT